MQTAVIENWEIGARTARAVIAAAAAGRELGLTVAAATQLGLRPLDQKLLSVMESARMLQLIACLALAPQLPVLADGLRPMLEQWRQTSET
jgi:hypothetical protein